MHCQDNIKMFFKLIKLYLLSELQLSFITNAGESTCHHFLSRSCKEKVFKKKNQNLH